MSHGDRSQGNNMIAADERNIASSSKATEPKGLKTEEMPAQDGDVVSNGREDKVKLDNSVSQHQSAERELEERGLKRSHAEMTKADTNGASTASARTDLVAHSPTDVKDGQDSDRFGARSGPRSPPHSPLNGVRRRTSSTSLNKSPSLPTRTQSRHLSTDASATSANAASNSRAVPTKASSDKAERQSGSPSRSRYGDDHPAHANARRSTNGSASTGDEDFQRRSGEMGKRLSTTPNGGSDGSSRAGGEYARQAGSNASNNDEDDEDGRSKRFQCHLCDRAFARAYNLNTHLATHDPDPVRAKPFPCPYPSCKADGGRSFSRKHDLQRHVASTHENEPEPGDEGETDEQGNRLGTLASLGLGTPGRKFRCEECGRAFVRRDALKRHQCVPAGGSPTSSAGGGAPRAPSTTERLASPSTPRSNVDATPDSPFAGAMPSGLSLYTSTGAQPSVSGGNAGSSSSVAQRYSSGAAPPTYDANAPFYPSGVTYESLTREVEDMAMHLVAQASSYNEKHPDRDKDERLARVGAATRK